MQGLTNQLEFRISLTSLNVEQYKALAGRAQTGQPDPMAQQEVSGSTSALGLAKRTARTADWVDTKGPVDTPKSCGFSDAFVDDFRIIGHCEKRPHIYGNRHPGHAS